MANATRVKKQSGSKADALKNHKANNAAPKKAAAKKQAPPKKAAAKKQAPPKKAAAKAGTNLKVDKVKPSEIPSLFQIPTSPTFKVKDLQKDLIPLDKERTETVVDQLVDVPVDAVRTRPNFNKRKDFGDIESLAVSLDEVGQVQPITVDAYKDGDNIIYILTNGERRFKAKLHLRGLSPEMAAKHATIKAIVNNRETTELDRLTIQALSNNGKPFEIIEEAELLAEMRDKHKLKPIDIAKRTGNSIARVEQLLLIADNDEEVKQHVKGGKISGTAVLEVSRQHKDKESRKKAVNDAVAAKGGKGKVKVKDVKKAGTAKKTEDAKPIIETLLGLIKEADKKNVDGDVRAMLFDIDKNVRKLKKLL